MRKKFHDTDFILSLCTSAIKLIDAEKPEKVPARFITETLEAVVAFQIHDPKIYQTLLNYIQDKINLFSPQDCVTTTWAICKLKKEYDSYPEKNQDLSKLDFKKL